MGRFSSEAVEQGPTSADVDRPVMDQVPGKPGKNILAALVLLHFRVLDHLLLGSCDPPFAEDFSTLVGTAHTIGDDAVLRSQRDGIDLGTPWIPCLQEVGVFVRFVHPMLGLENLVSIREVHQLVGSLDVLGGMYCLLLCHVGCFRESEPLYLAILLEGESIAIASCEDSTVTPWSASPTDRLQVEVHPDPSATGPALAW
mmetsp:Transcript_98485/g.205403  ORF Transcript_98485/g.205403 Transcript_98485/m.205403 type:complete len:200 (-) Transcript_98485:298-897(-)